MNRTHAFLAFLALAVLRIAVGYHFFKEGQAKLESGTFTAEYFLSGANGPLAPKFKAMLDDPDGMIALCAKRVSTEGQRERYQLDPTDTFNAWEKYAEKSSRYFGFGSEGLQKKLAENREKLGNKIRKARAEKDESVNTRQLEVEREDAARAIKVIREQPARLKEILADHKSMLKGWLDFNETEIVAHFGTTDRLEGFERDGVNRQKVGTYVESLRGQIDTIESDRSKKLKGWKKEIADMWSSLERQVNDLAVADQAERAELPLERSYAPSDSNLSLINRIIPWFDVIVGSLLILGLFTRLASLAGAGFLLSVLATQPFWVPGSDPTYLYMIEFAALLVIFATCAGRNFGLDYFVHSIFGRSRNNSSAEAGA
jgi:uncharacterized membrane protein YphA (DoxX/SURF4 family)